MPQSARKPDVEKNFGQKMAHGSLVAWLCAGGVVYMTRDGAMTGSGIMAGAFVVMGLLFGIVALVSTFKLGVRKILLPAVCGLLLNGFVLAIAVPNFVQTRSTPLNEQLTAEYDLQPFSSPFESSTHPYRFETPGQQWAMRSEASVRKGAKNAEVWLVDPARDAHLMVLPFVVDPGYEVDTEAMLLVTQKELERRGVRTQPTEAIQTRGVTGRRFDGEGVTQGMALRWRVAGFGTGRHGVEFICYGPPQHFAAFAPECDRAIGSVEFIAERLLGS
jgi:hypothetical protein